MDGGFWYDGTVPDGFTPEACRFFRYDSGILILDEARQQAALDFDAAQEELGVLYQWFVWYDTQVMQYTRAQRLGEACDIDIMALDEQAKDNQTRINELNNAISLEQG
jgi:hypothetical protein